MTATRILLALLSFAAVSTANAQGLPAEGPVSVTFTATQIPPFQTDAYRGWGRNT